MCTHTPTLASPIHTTLIARLTHPTITQLLHFRQTHNTPASTQAQGVSMATDGYACFNNGTRRTALEILRAVHHLAIQTA
jgi:hypothetical protein